MRAKEAELQASLGPEIASAFGGGSAGANVGFISVLPPRQKAIARQAFSDSLSMIWVVYVAFAGVGTLISLLIRNNVLDKEHEETKTGLEEEKRKRIERKQERVDRKRLKEEGKAEARAVPETQSEQERNRQV